MSFFTFCEVSITCGGLPDVKSVMLAEALLEKGIDADMNEMLPKIVDGLRYVKCYVIEYSDPVIIMTSLLLWGLKWRDRV